MSLHRLLILSPSRLRQTTTTMAPTIRDYSTTTAPPTPTKPSASLLLLSPTNHILLMTRPTSTSTTFSGAAVFPGGALDAQDNSSYPLCALREVFEECGVLLLKDRALFAGGEEWMQGARRDVHSGKRKFGEVVRECGGELDVEGVREFTRWITPPAQKRRFDTRMFLYMMDEARGKKAADVDSKEGEVQSEELPKGDGGIEVVSTAFVRLEKALEMNRKGEITFFPPQFYLISVLKRFLGEEVQGSIREKRERLVRYLEMSDFGQRVMEPRVEGVKYGKTVLALGPRGGKGKLLVKFDPKTGPRDLELLQNGLDTDAEGKVTYEVMGRKEAKL